LEVRAAQQGDARVNPALSYLAETEARKERTERKQHAREASAEVLIAASGGLLTRRGQQNHANRWRDTVALVDTVFDGNELGIEGQVDEERAHLKFSNLTITEAATLLRVLKAIRETAGTGAAGDADDGADWLAAIAA